jgi:lipopolysaccharide export system protein LptC
MQARRNRSITAGALVLLTLVTWSVLTLLREEPPPPKDVPVQGTEFAKPRLVGWSKGQRQWMVEAQAMNDSGNIVTLERIGRGVIYKDQDEYLTFTAGRGVWQKKVNDRDSSDLTLSGGVKVFKDGRSVFETTRLLWQEETSLLLAPEPVYFDYEGSTAEASRLTLNSVTEDVTLEGDIHFSLREGSRISVQGRLVYNIKSGAFQVEGTQLFELKT